MGNLKSEVQAVELQTELIDFDPSQPRTEFASEPLVELTASIGEADVIEPIHVVKNGERYQLLHGARRVRASLAAGKKTIRALIVPQPANDGERLLQQLLSNAHREDLNPMELCEAYLLLMAFMNLNATELAKKVSKSKTYVSNILSLDSLSDKAKQLILSGKIGLAKGALLARLNNEALETALNDLEDGTLGREGLERSTAKNKGKANDKPIRRVALETPKATVTLQGKSKISTDELIDLLQDLIRACKKARKDGLDLSTLAAILRDQAAAQDGGAAC